MLKLQYVLCEGLNSRTGNYNRLRYCHRDLLATTFAVLSSRSASQAHHSSSPVHHRSLCDCLVIYLQVSGITNQNIIAKKVLLNREMAIPTAETPYVSRADIASTSSNIPVSE